MDAMKTTALRSLTLSILGRISRTDRCPKRLTPSAGLADKVADTFREVEEWLKENVTVSIRAGMLRHARILLYDYDKGIRVAYDCGGESCHWKDAPSGVLVECLGLLQKLKNAGYTTQKKHEALMFQAGAHAGFLTREDIPVLGAVLPKDNPPEYEEDLSEEDFVEMMSGSKKAPSPSALMEELFGLNPSMDEALSLEEALVDEADEDEGAEEDE